LIVLDTFEEVQYGGESRASPLWAMLTNLQRSWPFLRVLVSGRAPVQYFNLGGSKPEEFELGDLDDETAKAIVMSAGISSPEVAAALVKQVGKVPLSLRLAALVVQKEGQQAGGVRNLRTSEYLFFKVSDEVIQGQLYGRILEHIHTKEVARLAHPGLVLRCIMHHAGGDSESAERPVPAVRHVAGGGHGTVSGTGQGDGTGRRRERTDTPPSPGFAAYHAGPVAGEEPRAGE
jgi:hypothetical protein